MASQFAWLYKFYKNNLTAKFAEYFAKGAKEIHLVSIMCAMCILSVLRAIHGVLCGKNRLRMKIGTA